MKNLLKETIDCLINNSKQPSDVLWVGMLGYDYDRRTKNPPALAVGSVKIVMNMQVIYTHLLQILIMKM